MDASFRLDHNNFKNFPQNVEILLARDDIILQNGQKRDHILFLNHQWIFIKRNSQYSQDSSFLTNLRLLLASFVLDKSMP